MGIEQRDPSHEGRRRRLAMRFGTFTCAFLLIAAALWGEKFPQMLSAWKHKEISAVVPIVPVPTAAPSIPSELGRAPAPPAPEGNDSSLSKTPQPLILSGTMPGRNPHEGHALIGINKDSPQTYVAGALLVNGVRLAEIYPRYVVLRKDSRSVKLYLQDSKEHDLQSTSDLLMVGGPEKFQPVEPSSKVMLSDYVRPTPVYDGDVIRGYQVYPGQRSRVFSELGLQAGDVILSLDGSPLSETSRAFEVLGQLTSGSAMTAFVERKGKTTTITLDGAAIIADQERVKAAALAPATMPPMPM